MFYRANGGKIAYKEAVKKLTSGTLPYEAVACAILLFYLQTADLKLIDGMLTRK